MRYVDGAVFRLKSNSRLTLLLNGVRLEFGDTWMNLQKAGSSFRVVTPLTVLGVLGTEFSVIHSADAAETIVVLHEGSLVAQGQDADEVTLLAPGDRLTASASGATIETVDFEQVLVTERSDVAAELATLGIDQLIALAEGASGDELTAPEDAPADAEPSAAGMGEREVATGEPVEPASDATSTSTAVLIGAVIASLAIVAGAVALLRRDSPMSGRQAPGQ